MRSSDGQLGARIESLNVQGIHLSTPVKSIGRGETWGVPPWKIDFRAAAHEMPSDVDVAIVGGGFTGLAAAAWLRHISPKTKVAVFEAHSIGAGASGRSGGMTLAESAAGDLPGLGDVLRGFSEILDELHVDCDLNLPGAWEIGRTKAMKNSPIAWNDSGDLRVTREFPGGTSDPGKLVSGLAREAERSGAAIFENVPVEEIRHEGGLRLRLGTKEVRARHAICATNAFSLEMSGLKGKTEAKLTFAVAIKPIGAAALEILGLASGRPFYTADLPYLWGRVLTNGGVVFGGGLVDAKDWRELESIDIATGRPAELIASLERRVRALHPALKNAEFTHWWGGPILFPKDWKPVLRAHAKLPNTIVIGAFAGHGVALSVYLGAWGAEAVLGRKQLPSW